MSVETIFVNTHTYIYILNTVSTPKYIEMQCFNIPGQPWPQLLQQNTDVIATTKGSGINSGKEYIKVHSSSETESV